MQRERNYYKHLISFNNDNCIVTFCDNTDSHVMLQLCLSKTLNKYTTLFALKVLKQELYEHKLTFKDMLLFVKFYGIRFEVITM